MWPVSGTNIAENREDVRVTPGLSAVVVLDLPIAAEQDGDPAGPILSDVRRPLDRARDASVPVFFTLVDGSLQRELSRHGITTLIIVGSWANISVMYTATTAFRQHLYDVILPVDGIAAPSDYEFECSLRQLRRIASLAPGLTGGVRHDRGGLDCLPHQSP